MLVSHDRYFPSNVTNRMVELNRVYPDGCLRGGEGNYPTFIERRADVLQASGIARRRRCPTNCVGRSKWLRRAPKARATKARYRVDSAPASCRRS